MMTTDRLLSLFSEIGLNSANMRGCGQVARVAAYAIRDMLPPLSEPSASAFVTCAENYAMAAHYYAVLKQAEDIGNWAIGNHSDHAREASQARTVSDAQLIGAWREMTGSEATAKGGA